MAFGGDVRVKVAVAAVIVRDTGPVVVFAGLLESVALTVTVAGPAVVGVPLTTQLEAVSPAGSPAVTTQVYGPVPPVTPIVALYDVPTVPFGSEERVRVTLAGSTVRLTGPVTVSVVVLESVALTVRFAVPATVGVPRTTQPEIESPAGNIPAVTVQE